MLKFDNKDAAQTAA